MPCGGGLLTCPIPTAKTRRGRVQEGGLICPTITAQNTGICVIELQEKHEKSLDI